jgi:hypothetical protein
MTRLATRSMHARAHTYPLALTDPACARSHSNRTNAHPLGSQNTDAAVNAAVIQVEFLRPVQNNCSPGDHPIYYLDEREKRKQMNGVKC